MTATIEGDRKNTRNSHRGAFGIDSQLLSVNRIEDCLRDIYSQEEIDYIKGAFDLEEFRIINDTHGIGINHCLSLARAEYFIQNEKIAAEHFASNYVPRKIDFPRYMAIQKPWIDEDAYLLGTRPNRKPSDGEIARDFLANENGLRFKLFMIDMYPHLFKKVR